MSYHFCASRRESFSIRITGPFYNRLRIDAIASVHAPNIVILAEGKDSSLSESGGTGRERGVHNVCSKAPSFLHTTKNRSVLPRGIAFRGNDDAEPLDKKAPRNKNPHATANRQNASFFYVHN